jgi:hypothetical protein
VIQQKIENPLANRILAGAFAEGDVIDVGMDSSKHDFTFGKGAVEAEPELAGGRS